MKKYNWDGESPIFVEQDSRYFYAEEIVQCEDFDDLFLGAYDCKAEELTIYLAERVQLNEIGEEDLLPYLDLPENMEFDDVVCDSVSTALTQLHNAIIESNKMGLTDVWKPTGIRLVELKDE